MKRPRKLAPRGSQSTRKDFHKQASAKSSRKLKARQEEDNVVWLGLGTFGLVGWSIAIPTLIGIALGVWIDLTWPSRYSWTLMLLFIGVVLGCLNAWYWVQQESRDE
ncbi:AtpZ/AtpI family protein [Halotia wernerae UHCC 0503]|nr:AtpZ/AtpI family protein [Halotia wernerae UHCC 0503]